MIKDLYDTRSAQAMLLTESEPFDSKDYIYELKLDGIRCLAYVEPGAVDLRNKRNKWLNPTYPELEVLGTTVQKRAILDGELVVMSEGRPDFYSLQRRSLMTDPFKISLEAKRNPVLFVAYDMIYYDQEDLIYRPLLERKKMLASYVKEGGYLLISRFIEEKGMEFYQLTVDQNLEGIVAKKKDSIYQQGKRSKYWVKIKYLKEADFILCGVIFQEDGTIKSLRLGVYDQENLVDYGHVSMGISKEDTKRILRHLREFSLDEHPYHKLLKTEKAEWMEPVLVGTVQFMMATEHGLRQPVFKGLRDDKDAVDCMIKQFEKVIE